MARRSTVEIPAGLRSRLEAARLELLTLLRALDRMDLAPAEIPRRLIRQLFQRDGDFAEALRALEQPPAASAQFRKNLPRRAHPTLAQEVTVRNTLLPAEPYNMIPGRDAQNSYAPSRNPVSGVLARYPVIS